MQNGKSAKWKNGKIVKWQNGKKAKRWSKKVSDGLRWFEMDKNIKKRKTKRQRQQDKDKKTETKMQKTKRRSEIVGKGFRWSEMV